MSVYVCLSLSLFLFSLRELKDKQYGGFVCFAAYLVLVVISGFRFEVGTDYVNYVRYFKYVDEIPTEPLYYHLSKFVHYVGGKYQLLCLICSALVGFVMFFATRRMTKCSFICLTFYLFSFLYFESMNTVRQAIAMSFSLLAVSFIYNLQNDEQPHVGMLCSIHRKKNINYIWFFVCYAIAILFHASAVILLPCVFLCKSVSWKKYKFFVLVITFLLGTVAMPYIIKWLTPLIKYVGYAGYLKVMEMRGVNSGMYQIYLNMLAVFVMVMTKGRLSKNENFYLNMFVLSICIYNLFLSFYVVLRLYFYFLMYGCLIIPAVLRGFTKRSRIIAYFVIIMSLGVFMFVSLNNKAYLPYAMNFVLF